MKFTLLFALAASLNIFSIPTKVIAGPPVRCDGMVQFRPCGQKLATGRPVPRANTFTTQKSAPRYDISPAALSHGSAPYVEVLSQSMSPLGSTTGQWRGSLRGNGSIKLQLQWFRDGVLSSTRSMGTVKLVHKITSFAFRTTLPRGAGWTWKIAAHAGPYA